MAAFFAIALDWNLASSSQLLELIDSGSSYEALLQLDEYDPAADSTKVLRAKFSIETLDAVEIRNCHTGNPNPAHICGLTAQ
jgi:hypothetical protein